MILLIMKGEEHIKQIHKRVSMIKSSEEIGVRYMQEWEERVYEIKEAEARGELRDELRGKLRGEERGIEAFILDYLEEGVSKERILAKLEKRFQIDNKTAVEYFEKYSQKAAT